MKSTLWGLGLIFSTLSVVMLAKQGLDVGFASSLQVILTFYDDAVHKIFGWAEPGIRAWFETLRASFGWDLHLYPHWKHVIVLYWLYFGAYARMRFEGLSRAEVDDKPRHWTLVALITLTGAIVAIVVGVVCGTLSLDDPQSNLPLLLIAVAGLILYELVKTFILVFGTSRRFIWERLESNVLYSVLPGACIVAVAIVALAWLSAAVPEINAVPSIAMLFVLMVGVALHDLWYAKGEVENSVFTEQSFRDILDQPRLSAKEQREWWVREFPTHCRMGLLMLSSIASAAVFLLTNAGLKLAGLS